MRLFSFRLKPRPDHDQPQHYFHRIKANGALVLHRQQRRPSLDEILGAPAIEPVARKKVSTWSAASRPQIILQQDDDLQARRQELLKHYLVQHQRHSKQLEDDDREKLQRQVQHLKRMVTLLRTLALSSTSLDDADSTVSYERKLQILFQEISALHREQDHSAQQYRELQHRHEALCAQLREKDEMVSCLQSDLRAYMINE